MSCEYLNEPMQIQHQCNAETVSLQQQPVVRIYVSQEKTGIDWAYMVVPEEMLLMYVENLLNDGAVTMDGK